MADDFQYDVFLSHNSKDKPRVRKLAEKLRSTGLKVWLDEWVIKAGEIIGLKVDEGLGQSRVLVLCVSVAALESGWVKLERYTAIHRDPDNSERRFVPLILVECDLPETIRRYKYIKYLRHTAKAFSELVEACRGDGEASSPAVEPKVEVPDKTVTAKKPGKKTATGVVENHSRLFQLPPAPAVFVGRETDLKQLRTLKPGAGAVITGLKGMGGIGKTALAQVLAHEWKDQFPDAQLWLDGLGTSTEPPSVERLLEQVLQAFHPQAKLPESMPELRTLYHQTLQGKRVLVVLDNARDLPQAKHLVPPPGCGLIVTSRMVIDLGSGTLHKVGKLFETEAIALLRELYPPLTDAEGRELAELCAGLPLALRLAGSHLRQDAVDREDGRANVAGYVKALRAGRLALLDREAADADLVTITETLALSEKQLGEAERQAWRRLGVFSGSFDVAAAQAVGSAEQSLLEKLVRRSLLEREREGDRFRLHDLAAEYALARLREAGMEREARLAHARHYVTVANDSQKQYLTGDPLGGLALFDRERHQLEAAFRWLSGEQEPEADRVLIKLINNMVHTGQELRFHPQERIAWLQVQLGAAQRTGNLVGESSALGNLGVTFENLGDPLRAIKFHRQHLKITQVIGDRSGEGCALGNLGLSYYSLSKPLQAIGYHKRALAISREIGDRRAEGQDLGNLGLAYADLGETGQAIDYYEQQIKVSREIGNIRSEGNALGNLGQVCADIGEFSRACELFQQALIISRQIGDKHGEAADLINSAQVLWSLGNRAEALSRAEQALTIFEAIEDPNVEKVREKLTQWRAEEGTRG